MCIWDLCFKDRSIFLAWGPCIGLFPSSSSKWNHKLPWFVCIVCGLQTIYLWNRYQRLKETQSEVQEMPLHPTPSDLAFNFPLLKDLLLNKLLTPQGLDPDCSQSQSIQRSPGYKQCGTGISGGYGTTQWSEHVHIVPSTQQGSTPKCYSHYRESQVSKSSWMSNRYQVNLSVSMPKNGLYLLKVVRGLKCNSSFSLSLWEPLGERWSSHLKEKNQNQLNLCEVGRRTHMAGGETPWVTEAKGWGAGLRSPEEFVRSPELLGENRGSRGGGGGGSWHAADKCMPFILAAWHICPIFSGSCLDSVLLLICRLYWGREQNSPGAHALLHSLRSLICAPPSGGGLASGQPTIPLAGEKRNGSLVLPSHPSHWGSTSWGGDCAVGPSPHPCAASSPRFWGWDRGQREARRRTWG